MVQPLCVRPLVGSIPPNKTHSQSLLIPSSSSSPSLFIRFRTSYRENLRYLKALRIISTRNNNARKIFSRDEVHQILSVVDFLKSKGFSEAYLQRLAFLCPKLFFSGVLPADLDPVFEFLSGDLSASPEEVCGLIVRCPELLFSHVDFCLKPTLVFLRDLGLERLNSPTTLNAHLLNTRVEKLVLKIRFLESLGISYEESATVCARFPAIFGYSVENNLRPKVEYLVIEMERSLEDLKAFPQYLAFSLERRIVPRHLHLKDRNVRVPLHKMLLWSDEKFFKKWK